MDWGALGMLMAAGVAPPAPLAKSVPPSPPPVEVPRGNPDAGQPDQGQHPADDGEIADEGIVGHGLAERRRRRGARAESHQTHDQEGAGLAPVEPGRPRRFDLMALQRNLKALGTFGYQAVARANPAYAQYVPRTLDYVRRGLSTHRRFGNLHDLLADSLPELV